MFRGDSSCHCRGGRPIICLHKASRAPARTKAPSFHIETDRRAGSLKNPGRNDTGDGRLKLRPAARDDPDLLSINREVKLTKLSNISEKRTYNVPS